LAAAGKDFDRYRNWLESHNINLAGVRIIPTEFTAGAYITTDQADNQITGFNPGAMKHPCHYCIDGIAPEKTIAIVAPGNLHDMVSYSDLFKKHSIDYIADPGQSIPALNDAQLMGMIEGAALLISNDYELELIKKRTAWDISDLLRRTRAVITTLGENGAWVHTRVQSRCLPAARVDAVRDPTGAGDAFRAGLLKGLVLGKDLMDAAAMGATCAAYAVEHYGTQEHGFTLDQFGGRLLSAFGLTM
jgi:adenosine kinase